MSKYNRGVLIVVTAFSLFRMIIAVSIGLGVDESYVVSIARHFSLSYIDHPPLHIWIAGLIPALFGSQHPVAVRMPFILLFAGTSLLMYRLTSRLFNNAAGFYAVCLLNISAVFSLSTGGWVLPDGPLMFFMLLGANILIELVFNCSYSTGFWIVFGIVTGLAMLSKYHGVFLFVGLFVFLFTTPKYRPLILSWGPYLSMLAAAAVFSPVIIWNAQHQWLSFIFQGSRGVAKGFYPVKMLSNILGQAAWVLPWLWVPLIWKWIKGMSAGPQGFHVPQVRHYEWLLICLASGPIILFTIVTLWGAEGLPHWQAPGYLFLFPLLGQTAAKHMDARNRRTKTWLVTSFLAYVMIVILLASHTATGWMKQAAPTIFAKGDPTIQALDWLDVKPQIEKLKIEQGKDDLFIITRSWIDAGKIDYAVGQEYQVLCLSDAPHQYSFIYKQQDFVGRNALIIGRKSVMRDVQDEFAPYFASLERRQTIQLYRREIVEEELECYLAKGFRGNYPLPYGEK